MALARQPADSAAAHLALFGAFHLTRDGNPIRLPTRKAEALLAYLALFPQTHSREELAGLFWGDAPDEQARGSLRKALTALRRALGDDALLADRLTVRLNPEYPLAVDALTFERGLRAGRPAVGVQLEPAPDLLSAVALYSGELLSGCDDDWVVPLRERYRELYLESALSLVQTWRARSDYGRAVEYAQQVLRIDPANERAHQHLMFCYLALGRRSEALQQYEICRRLLWEELAVAPSAETTALYRWLKEGAAERPAAEARITNLPIPLSSFVGREAETARVKQLFLVGEPPSRPGEPVPPAPSTPAVRLVTLSGPGGSGKTRLAIQVGADLIDAFPDGVWWVELAGLDDAKLVPHAVANALGARESPDEQVVDTLIAFLQDRHLLLILDNCEHLITATATLADALLGRCPRLAVLATSRQALGLIGERSLPVPALAVPPATLTAAADALLGYDGIRLFVDRARAVNPAFAVSASNAPAVRQICARLDGIPLAIELAAMWMRALPAEELAARLDDRFQLLTSGSRAAPPRHQTLRGVIDWSHDLLPAPEQVLFRRLSVFAGGCTPEAARHVLNMAGADAPEATLPVTLDLLQRLVDKSLVVAGQERGRARFTMLETMREYAREKLREAGEAEAARTAHLQFFARLVEEAESDLRGPQQLRQLELLDQELDNLRAALDWSAANDPQAGLRLVGASVWFWNLRGHWREGPMWMEKLLSAPTAAALTPARARALIAAANLAHWGSNDFGVARDQLDEAVAILRAWPALAWDLAYALTLLGAVRLNLDDPEGAAAALDESLALGGRLGDDGKWVQAWAWMSLGDLAADPAETQVRLERSASIFRRLDDRAQLPVVLAHLAWFHLQQGHHAEAESYAAEGMTLTDEIGDVMGAAWFQKLRGDLALAQQDDRQAQERYQDALQRFRALGSKSGIADALGALGRAYRAANRLEDARRAWTEALVYYEAMDQPGGGAFVLKWLEELADISR